MRKFMIVTGSSIKVFDEPFHLMSYKNYLIASKVLYKEYEFQSDEDIGLRGIAGVRAARAV